MSDFGLLVSCNFSSTGANQRCNGGMAQRGLGSTFPVLGELYRKGERTVAVAVEALDCQPGPFLLQDMHDVRGPGRGLTGPFANLVEPHPLVLTRGNDAVVSGRGVCVCMSCVSGNRVRIVQSCGPEGPKASDCACSSNNRWADLAMSDGIMQREFCSEEQQSHSARASGLLLSMALEKLQSPHTLSHAGQRTMHDADEGVWSYEMQRTREEEDQEDAPLSAECRQRHTPGTGTDTCTCPENFHPTSIPSGGCRARTLSKPIKPITRYRYSSIPDTGIRLVSIPTSNRLEGTTKTGGSDQSIFTVFSCTQKDPPTSPTRPVKTLHPSLVRAAAQLAPRHGVSG